MFYDTDYFPDELAKNRCLALFVNAIENNSLLNTKINFEIKDCFNKVVYVSNQGESREKDLKCLKVHLYQSAEALKKAMDDILSIESEILLWKKTWLAETKECLKK